VFEPLWAHFLFSSDFIHLADLISSRFRLILGFCHISVASRFAFWKELDDLCDLFETRSLVMHVPIGGAVRGMCEEELQIVPGCPVGHILAYGQRCREVPKM
jgi:hypothetical protein